MSSMSSGNWIKNYESRPAAELRLFCLPYAGGGASLYRDWSQDLPPEVEVRAIQPPGREERLLEEPHDSVEDLVGALVEPLAAELDRPYALFGHSMGALVAFELVRELRARGAPQPTWFFASGHRAPQIPCPVETIHELSADEFLHELNRRYDAVPQAARESAELLELFLPGLRADVAVCDTYGYADGEPFDFPITAVGGDADEIVKTEEVAAWREQTTGAFRALTFAGDHFFVKSARDELLRELSTDLQQALGRPGLS